MKGRKHRWARGEEGGGVEYSPNGRQKSDPPRPTTYLLLFSPLTGWPPKKFFFVKNSKILAAFGGCKVIFSFFKFYSPPLKVVTCPSPPLGVQKPLPTRPKFGWPPSQLPTPRPPMVENRNKGCISFMVYGVLLLCHHAMRIFSQEGGRSTQGDLSLGGWRGKTNFAWWFLLARKWKENGGGGGREGKRQNEVARAKSLFLLSIDVILSIVSLRVFGLQKKVVMCFL